MMSRVHTLVYGPGFVMKLESWKSEKFSLKSERTLVWHGHSVQAFFPFFMPTSISWNLYVLFLQMKTFFVATSAWEHRSWPSREVSSAMVGREEPSSDSDGVVSFFFYRSPPVWCLGRIWERVRLVSALTVQGIL